MGEVEEEGLGGGLGWGWWGKMGGVLRVGFRGGRFGGHCYCSAFIVFIFS